MTDLHPTGYGTQLLSLPDLILRHCAGAEPETVCRVIEYLTGRPELGIGSGWRPCPSDTSDASLLCKSFHQTQTFRDGSRWFTAFDFVRRNPNPLKAHISLKTGDLPLQNSPGSRLPPVGLGLHANVGTPGTSQFEPWHGQPSEIDGFDSWVQAGRKRPTPVLTIPFPPKPPPPDFYDTTTGLPMNTYTPLTTPQRFFDTRGFGGPVAAGEYHPLPPYPVFNDYDDDDGHHHEPLTKVGGDQIRGVKVNVKIVDPTAAGFAIAYTTPGATPTTSIIDFAANAPGAGCNPPAYNAMIDLPVTSDGHFQVFINVPAGIVCDLYGYWT